MNVLALETSGSILSIALRTSQCAVSLTENWGFKHCETLLPAIHYLTSKAGISPEALELAACSAGPGSFTGLRIGMATAKGIARGAGCGFKAIPTLSTLAAGRENWPGIVLPLIDARKSRVYISAFKGGQRIEPDCDIKLDDFLSRIPHNELLLFTGADALEIAGHMASESNKIDPLAKTGRADLMLDLAQTAYEQTGSDPMDTGPAYIRLSDAEWKWK